MGWAKYNEDDREICEDRWALRESASTRNETLRDDSRWISKLSDSNKRRYDLKGEGKANLYQ